MRASLWGLALLLSCSPIAAGPDGGDVGDGGEDAGSLPPPTLVSTVPAAGATGVSLDATLELTFSRAMDVGSLVVTTSPDLTFAPLAWTGSTSVVFTPTEPLSEGVAYHVTVSARATDGQPLAGATQFAFTTVSLPPSVAYTSPSDGATNVPPSTMVTLAFSRPMNRASVESAFLSTPQLNCAWAWNAEGSEATCAPATTLVLSMHYQMRLLTSARAIDGQPLSEALAFSFDTGAAGDTEAPTVLFVKPGEGERGVARDSTIHVVFSEPMDKSSVRAALRIINPATSGVLTWNLNGTEVTFNPASDFAYGTQVTWVVQTGAKDLAGNALAAAVTHTFTAVRSLTVSLPAASALSGTTERCSNFTRAEGDLFVGQCLETVVTCGAPGGQCYTHTSRRRSTGLLTFSLQSLVTGGATRLSEAVLYAKQTHVFGAPYSALGGRVYAEHTQFSTPGNDLTLPVLSVCVGNPPVCLARATLSTDAALEWKSTAVTAFVADDLREQSLRNGRSQFAVRFASVPEENVGEGEVPPYHEVQFRGGAAPDQAWLRVTYEVP